MRTMTKAELVNDLADMGYKIQSGFNYTNNLNSGPSYKARSNYIVEADTGISFAHYADARRDDNFKALQAYRFEGDILINGIVYEL